MTIEKLKQHHKYAKHTYSDGYSPEMLLLRDEIQKFIDSIEDGLTRNVLFHRYILGESWSSIAKRFNFGTPDCYRKISERYIEKALKG